MEKRTKIMGILNVTPDSFYDGGVFYDRANAIERACKIAQEGADIIDIGGESTKPGSDPVSLNEEIDRVCPVIEEISKNIGIPISIDTNKSGVAEAAIQAGATIVNDVSSFSFDEKMADVVAKYNTEVVLMHIKGIPKTMQDNPEYGNLIEEIYLFLEKARKKAIDCGINSNNIILDPGIGFGKTLEDNYVIINNLDVFKKIGSRILIGLSRKSLIGKLYDKEFDRLPATIALNTISIQNGADIIRVHDVKEHRLALESLEMLERVSY